MAVTTARKITGYSDISEQVASEKSIYKEVVRQDVLVNSDATSMKVYVNELSTIATYVPGTGVAQSADGSAYVTVSNLTEDALNEILDGFTVETAPADMVVSRMVAGMETRGESNDTKVFTGMIANGTELIAAAEDKPVLATVYSDILALKGALDTAKAPKTGRKLIINSEMENLLLHVDSKIILDTNRGDKIQTEGFVGRLLGFDVFSTELLPEGTNMIALQMRGYAAKEIFKVEPRLQNLDGSGTFIGDSAIQDRVAFIHGSIRPTFIQVNNGAA